MVVNADARCQRGNGYIDLSFDAPRIGIAKERKRIYTLAMGSLLPSATLARRPLRLLSDQCGWEAVHPYWTKVALRRCFGLFPHPVRRVHRHGAVRSLRLNPFDTEAVCCANNVGERGRAARI